MTDFFNHDEAPEESFAEPTINYQMDILPGIVGWVIGRSGCRIKYIQQECGCKMWIDQDVPDSQPRKLFLQGTEKSIKMALNILSQVISEAPLLGGMYGSVTSLISRTVEIPPELIGLLIGKKGWTIKKIQAESGAQLAINQSVRDGQPRKIIVSGDGHSVEMAIALIQDSLRTKSRRDGGHVNLSHPNNNQVNILHSNQRLVEMHRALESFRARENPVSVPVRNFNAPRQQNRNFVPRGRQENQQNYRETDYIANLLQQLNIGSGNIASNINL